MSLFQHDTRTFVEENGYDMGPVEAGEYLAMITDAGEKVSNTTGTPYAYIKVEIVEGRYKGRRIYDNMFLNSANSKAVSIAKNKLNAICKSIGVEAISSPMELINKVLKVKVGYDKMDTSRNIITGYGAKEQFVYPAAMQAERHNDVMNAPF